MDPLLLFGYALIFVYGSLAFFAVAGGWSATRGSRQVRLIWFVLLPSALFIALWFSGEFVWSFIYFFWILGDDNSLPGASRSTAIALARVIPLIVFGRLAGGWAERRYRLILFFTSMLLLAGIGAFAAYRFAEQIDGWTARGAAEGFFERAFHEELAMTNANAKSMVRIVEEDLSKENPDWAKGGWFVLYKGHRRTSYVHVVPHGPFWWTIAGSGNWFPEHDMTEAAENTQLH